MPDFTPDIRQGLTGVGLTPAAEAAVVEELSQHLDDRYRELIAAGATNAEAHRAALAELAEGDLFADALRQVHGRTAPDPVVPGAPGRNPFDALWQDLRYAVRMLRQRPGFAVVAVLTLALGIGANTAIFSLVNLALFTPIHAERPDELVVVFFGNANGEGSSTHSYANYQDYRRESGDVLTGLAAFNPRPASVRAAERAERLLVGLVTENYLGTLGVRPLIGRDFTPQENVTPGGHPVALVSEDFWRRTLGANPNLGSKPVWVHATPYTVIGVVPDRATRMVAVMKVDVFVPAVMSGAVRGGTDPLTERGNREFQLVGRLRPGVTVAQAQAVFDVIAARLQRAYPDVWMDQGRPLPLTVIAERHARPSVEFRRILVTFSGVLMAVVGGVLLIACANLANVLLARGLARRQELAVRIALGAGRGRLVRQLLAENLLLALFGGAAGLLLALWVKGLFTAFQPRLGVPLVVDLALDHRVLLFTAGMTLLTTMVFGLMPALQATRPDVVSGLQEGQRTQAGARRTTRLRGMLLVAQVALSLLLLVCAGLFLRSLVKLQQIDVGFERDRIALLSVDAAIQGDSMASRQALVERAMEALRRVPGVENVDVANKVPIGFSNRKIEMLPEGLDLPPDQAPLFGFNFVGPRYFDTMGLRLLRGRAITDRDREGSARVAVVNEAVVQRYWRGQDPIGKRMRAPRVGIEVEVVGVVATSRYHSLFEEPVPFVYFAQAQSERSELTFHVRTHGAPEPRLDALRRQLLAVDARLAVFDVTTMNEHLAVSLLPMRFGALWLGVFGALALALAVIGLYGVMAFLVGQRTHEIGLRVALGAERRDVLRLVIRQGMTLIICGMAIGLVPSALVSVLAARQLYGLTPTDVIVLTGVVIVQGTAAWLACWVPARRAARMDPVAALRQT